MVLHLVMVKVLVDFALTTDGSMLGIDGLALGVGYGEVEAWTQQAAGTNGDTTDIDWFR